MNERLPEPVEVSAYYVIAEALTNAAKHARAATVNVQIEGAAGRRRRVAGCFRIRPLTRTSITLVIGAAALRAA